MITILLILPLSVIFFFVLCRNAGSARCILLQKHGDSSCQWCAKLPPGPRGLPLIGNLHQLFFDSLHISLHNLASNHGPLMSLRLGSVRTLVISSADAVRDAFKDVARNDIALSGRPKLYAASILFYGPRDIAFVPYGDSWRLARKACIVDLLSPRRVQSFRTVREEEVAAVLNYVSDASSRGAAVNFSELVMQHVNDVTCRLVFGRKFLGAYGGEERLREILTETQALLGAFCVSDYFPGMEWVEALTGFKRRVWRNFRKLDAFFDDVLRSHLHSTRSSEQDGMEDMNIEDGDLVTQLLRHQNDPKFGGVFTCMDSIKGILMDMFIAGTDTSTATLVWTMAELIKNPKVLKRVHDEIRSKIYRTNTIIDETVVSNLSYLKLAIKESLRLHPPAPLLVHRETTETITIRGYTIPSNTRVIINVRAIGRDPNYWEKPDVFNPDRFLVTGQDVDFKGHHFHFLPFGVGRRICPGINFSMASVELILANLLCWFDWKLPYGESIEELDMEDAPGITVLKKTPLLLATSKWMQ